MSFFIKIMNGKDKGVEYKLLSKSVLIGRAKYNDIALSDMKVSRKHAIVNVTEENNVTIKKISPSNKIIVNGVDTGYAILEPDSTIKLGQTNLKFINRYIPNKKSNTSDYSTKPKSSSTFYISLFLIISGAIYFIISESYKDKSNPIAKTEVNVGELASINEKTTDHYRSLEQTGKNTLEYKEAQALYIQGFRDYREQNFVRAIDYFNGALALFPNHILAKRYLTQSRTKLDYLIQSALSEANDYYEKRQYNRAISGYKHILILVGDKNSVLLKEVKARLEEAQLLLKSQGDF